MCFLALIPHFLSVGVENGGEKGQQSPNQGCCWDLCDKSHPEALREAGISPSITELDGCFPKTVPSLGASLSH